MTYTPHEKRISFRVTLAEAKVLEARATLASKKAKKRVTVTDIIRQSLGLQCDSQVGRPKEEKNV